MDEKLLLEQIDAFVAENRENVLRDLKTLVDINSVEGQPQPGAPFGPGPRKALEAALDIAAGMGLDAHNCEGYIGYADLPGASPTQIATITHLDVVPEGNGWTGSPFDMVRRDGYVVGRGVADDKGPAVLTLYAAKFFKQQGATLPYTLRILLGANEETGMKDVDYYLEHYPQPAFCFTPDAEFPVCYGEKGGYGGWLVSAPLHGSLIDFQGGVAHNVVPDRAYALVRADASALKDTENVKVTAEADGVARISAFGKGGHAAMPAGTVNAIALVVDYLLDNRLCSEEEARALEMLRRLHASTDGSSVGIAAQDDVFDPLTCVGGVIKHRHPFPHQHQCRDAVRRAVEAGAGRGRQLPAGQRPCSVLYRPQYPGHPDAHPDVQRCNGQKRPAFHYGRRHLCAPLQMRRQLRYGRDRRTRARMGRAHARPGRGRERGAAVQGTEDLYPGHRPPYAAGILTVLRRAAAKTRQQRPRVPIGDARPLPSAFCVQRSRLATSANTCALNSSTVFVPPFSSLRARTLTVPFSISCAPTTSM